MALPSDRRSESSLDLITSSRCTGDKSLVLTGGLGEGIIRKTKKQRDAKCREAKNANSHVKPPKNNCQALAIANRRLPIAD